MGSGRHRHDFGSKYGNFLTLPSKKEIGMQGNVQGPLTEINMTPFVDIVLVILIIFLLTATVMMPRTFSIALPKACQADKMESIPIIISIDREGHIAVNGVKLGQDNDFEPVFTTQKQGKEPQAVIAADTQTQHGRLIEVIDRLRALKVERIGIEVEQK
jgi:biopolymer transport protein ExbD